MSTPCRLWGASPAARCAVPVAADYALLKESGIYDLHRRSLLDGWSDIQITLHRQRKTDKACDISTLYASNAVCLPRAVATNLLSRSLATRCVELLPLHLGEEEWTLLNVLHSAKQVGSEGGLVSRIPWLNVVEPQAMERGCELLCVPVVGRDSAARHLVFTDVVVERINKLGLRGLDFEHVGYIVADPSQAVPKPAEPSKPSLTPSKRRGPKLTTVVLPAAEQIELARAASDWRQRMRLLPDAETATVLQRLAAELRTLRPTFWTISADERLDATLGLSAIYGELICKHAGWKWTELHQSKRKQLIAVASPEGHHALALLPYIQQQINAPQCTLELVFNMIQAGTLPDPEPGQVKVIA